METLVLTVLTVVIAAVAIGIPAYFRRRNDESVSVDATLSQEGGLELVNTIGCAGLVLTVIGKSKRSARISGACLCLKGFDALPAFQKAFGTDFGYRSVPSSEPVFVIELIPLSQPNSGKGWVLERDEVCRFFLPICCPALPNSIDAPSESVTIKVAFQDGSEHVVLQGMTIQSQVKGLIEVWGQAVQSLKVPLNVRVETITGAPPDISIIGTTNPNPLRFSNRTEQNES